MDIQELLQQVEEVKEYCCKHDIDWDKIKCDYTPTVLTYEMVNEYAIFLNI